MSDYFPEPGEFVAIQGGCICTVRDGEPQDNDKWPEWLVRGCPLHEPPFEAEQIA